jgi:anti-sigma regulatory factor (Ser/Thr protein kinase)
VATAHWCSGTRNATERLAGVSGAGDPSSPQARRPVASKRSCREQFPRPFENSHRCLRSRPIERETVQLDSTDLLVGIIERHPEHIRVLRSRLRDFLRRLTLTPEEEFALLVAAGEATTNALRYGSGEHIHWTARLTRRRVVLDLHYATEPFDPAESSCALSEFSERGRGILMMRSLVDDVRYRFGRGEVRVSLVKDLHDARPG